MERRSSWRSAWERRILDCFPLPSSPSSCVCLSTPLQERDGFERKALLKSQVEHVLKIKDVLDTDKTLAFHLEPKTVVLRVAMHCGGCARRIEKHISKMEEQHMKHWNECSFMWCIGTLASWDGMEQGFSIKKETVDFHSGHVPHQRSAHKGVSSFEVDLENKKVVVIGDVTPFEVVQSVSKVKFAELWLAQ